MPCSTLESCGEAAACVLLPVRTGVRRTGRGKRPVPGWCRQADEGQLAEASFSILQRIQTCLHGDENARRLNKNNPLHETPSPPTKLVPTISPFRHGYTGRRAGEAEPVPVVKGRREPSPSGSAENGLPPATRGKRQGFGPACRFRCPNGASDVPVRHTWWPEGWFRRASTKSVRESGKPGGKGSSGKATAEGPESWIKTAERGAERCHL